MNTRVRIYQIFYRDSQAGSLDQQFTPAGNFAPRFPQAAESGVFVERYPDLPFAEYDVIGFVSWKFERKTGVTGTRMVEFIKANPGFDIYAINPSPHMEGFWSAWQQGECFHPGITRAAQSLLVRAGHDLELGDLQFSRTQMVFCNYWAATSRFWDRYIHFLRPIVDAYYSLPPGDPLLNTLDRVVNHTNRTNYLPYILERMFPTFLALNPDLTLKKFEYTKDDLKRRYDPVTRFFIRNAHTGLPRSAFMRWITFVSRGRIAKRRLRP